MVFASTTNLEEKPKKVKILFTFDDGPHAADPSGNNYTVKVLNTLKENSFQKNIKAMWCIQTHVSYRGGSSYGKEVIQKQWNEDHIVAIHTGSTEDHIDHRKRVALPAYDINNDGYVNTNDGENALESDMIRAKSRIFQLTGTTPKYVRPVGGLYNSDVLNVYNKQNLKLILWDIDSYDTHGLTVDEIKSHLQKRLKEEINKENYEIVILFHELKSVTHGYLEEYIQTLDEAAKEKNFQLEFPTTRQDVVSILNKYN